jgi:hypothetical protein
MMDEQIPAPADGEASELVQRCDGLLDDPSDAAEPMIFSRPRCGMTVAMRLAYRRSRKAAES